MRPRVLHVITGLDPGGSARHVVDISAKLAGEFEFAIACGPGETGEATLRSYADRGGVRILDVPSLSRRSSILADRRALRELGESIRSFAPGVVHDTRNRASQPRLLIDLGEQGNAGITGDVTTAETGFDFSASNGWKFDGSLVAFCHGGKFTNIGLSTCIFENFPPFCYTPRAIFGLATSTKQR